ncbi:MAG: hypothetical protein EOO46_13980, partial [Flavobacterium sp.]
MSDKKNIDRLFQEKFKDFEVEPNEQIWINIDAALREKKKRRVIPIWFKLTGIAAGLILGFFAFNFLFDNTTPVESNKVVIGTKNQSNENNAIGTPENESVVSTENPNENKPIEKNNNPSSINPEGNDTNVSTTSNDAIVNQTQSQKTNKVNSGISSEENNAVAATSSEVKKSSTKKKTIRNSIAPR